MEPTRPSHIRTSLLARVPRGSAQTDVRVVPSHPSPSVPLVSLSRPSRGRTGDVTGAAGGDSGSARRRPRPVRYPSATGERELAGSATRPRRKDYQSVARGDAGAVSEPLPPDGRRPIAGWRQLSVPSRLRTDAE